MAKSTGIAQFSQGKQEVFKVDPHLLIIDETDDYREMNAELETHIDELAQSIAEIGVKKPIEVKLENGKMYVKEGRCRTRAAMLAISKYKAKLSAVPVISVERYANDSDLVLNQVIGNSGKQFAPIELARIFKKLLDMGMQQTDIAKRTGKTNGRVSQVLDLLTMPTSVQNAVASGTVSASLAQQVVQQAETPAAASQALQEAVKTAKSEGRKVKPSDVGVKVHADLYKNLKQAFDDSDIDCSAEVIETGVVHITMPVENWDLVRKLLEL